MNDLVDLAWRSLKDEVCTDGGALSWWKVLDDVGHDDESERDAAGGR